MSLDFGFSAEHEAVRETVRRMCRDELAPLVTRAEEEESFPREVFRRWGELGLLGVRYPEAVGGSGMDKISDCIVREELSFCSQAFASSWSAHSHLGIWPIWRAGTPEQRARCFVPALAGRKIAAFALSEPDGGAMKRQSRVLSKSKVGNRRFRVKSTRSNARVKHSWLKISSTKPNRSFARFLR